MKGLQFFCGSSSGSFSCSNWEKILIWGSVCWKRKHWSTMSSIPKRIYYSFVCKHNVPLNYTLLSNHTWKMTTLPSSTWRYNVHEEVMKLWAWFMTSSQRPLTKVSGYSRCILGIMASNCKENEQHWAPCSKPIPPQTTEWVWQTQTCSCRRSANGSWLWQPRLHANCSSLRE